MDRQRDWAQTLRECRQMKRSSDTTLVGMGCFGEVLCKEYFKEKGIMFEPIKPTEKIVAAASNPVQPRRNSTAKYSLNYYRTVIAPMAA